MTVEIVIPVQSTSRQLDITVKALERFTASPYSLRIVVEPELNVSEARQKAMDGSTSEMICFLDDDSEMIHPGWLGAMVAVMNARPDAGAVFAGEWRGDNPQPDISVPLGSSGVHSAEIEYGPAACMLIDRRRIPGGFKWDTNIGLRSGWLGGDFEEVDYCLRLWACHELKCYRAENTLFHHTGGKTTDEAWRSSARGATVRIMSNLVRYRTMRGTNDPEWFKKLRYVKADPNDDTQLAGGSSLRECYHDLIVDRGLTHVADFRQMGLV